MPEFVPGSDYVQDNGDGTYTTVVGGDPIYTGSKSGAEDAFNSVKGGGGGGGAGAFNPNAPISAEHREGLRTALYPKWNDANLTEGDWQRISAGARSGGGGAGGIGGIGAGAGMGNLNILPIEQMRLAIELANQEYLRKRLEMLEIPEMQRRLELEGRNTENDRHKIALDAATSFAQVSGWYLPGSFIENMVFQEYPGMVEGVTPVYPQQPGQQPGQGPGQIGIMPNTTMPPPGQVTALGATGGQPGGGGGAMTAMGATAAAPTGRQFKDAKGQIKTVDNLKAELKVAGWPGPAPGKTVDDASVEELVAAYTRTTGATLTEITDTGAGTQPGATPGFPALPPQYPGAPASAYDQNTWMPTLDREKWWFDKQKYLTDLAANPRNLTQALLMLGMSPGQVSSFLQNSPSVNYLLNQGSWDVNLDPGAPSPYWDRTTGLPITPGSGPTPEGIPGPGGQLGGGQVSTNPVFPPQPLTGQPGGGQVGIPGGVPVMSPDNPLMQNPALQSQATTGNLVSALGTLASPTIGGTTMPTDYNNPFDFSQYFQQPRTEPVNPWQQFKPEHGQPFDWRRWIQSNPWRNRFGQGQGWGQGAGQPWQAPPGYDLGGGNQPISALGAGSNLGGGYMTGSYGYDANGNPVPMGGQAGQPNVPGPIQDIMRSTPQGPLGTRNPNFPFITGRQMPVRQTLNWMDTNSPMIKLLQGLFSYSGQEPGNAFAEFQSFLPKGTTAGPTTYY